MFMGGIEIQSVFQPSGCEIVKTTLSTTGQQDTSGSNSFKSEFDLIKANPRRVATLGDAVWGEANVKAVKE